MGWLILIAYIVGFLLTWVIAYALLYKNMSEDHLAGEGPLMIIMLSGVLSLLFAMFWPLVLITFGIHRIATYKPTPRTTPQNGESR